MSKGGEPMAGSRGSGAYRAGVGVVLVTSFLVVWTTIVRDDGSGMGPFMVMLSPWVGGFAASFRASGMARAMVGVAVLQALLGLAAATAPSTAILEDGVLKAVVFNAVFVALWLISGAFFRAAAKGGGKATSAADPAYPE